MENSPRIALIDDDALFRESLILNLTAVGYAVRGWEDGEAFLAALGHQEKPDLVLLDWKMPGLNGIEVLARLRVFRPELPVIFLTVLGQQVFEEAAPSGGIGLSISPSPNSRWSWLWPARPDAMSASDRYTMPAGVRGSMPASYPVHPGPEAGDLRRRRLGSDQEKRDGRRDPAGRQRPQRQPVSQHRPSRPLHRPVAADAGKDAHHRRRIWEASGWPRVHASLASSSLKHSSTKSLMSGGAGTRFARR